MGCQIDIPLNVLHCQNCEEEKRENDQNKQYFIGGEMLCVTRRNEH